MAIAMVTFAAIGSYIILTSKASTTLAADFNSDGRVDIGDLSILAGNWGKSRTNEVDFNKYGDADYNGRIDIIDLSILATQFGQTDNSNSGSLAVTSLSAGHARTGSTITINGRGFGNTQGASKVYFGKMVSACNDSSWSNASIICTVPKVIDPVAPVTVVVGTTTSNEVNFTVDLNLYNVVTQGHLDNTGGTGVTADINTAITSYKAGGYDGLYFPTGTYQLATTLVVPDGTNFYGPTNSGPNNLTAHLKGAVVYNSNSSFTDLKFGDINKTGMVNGPNASNTSFTRCQFRGGGALETYPMRFGGGTNSAKHITLTDCNIERNLYVGSDPAGFGANNLGWMEGTGSLTGSHMEYIYFTGCHFGVSNGLPIARNIGAPRMNVELYMNPQPNSNYEGVRHGWHHVWFINSIFEAADGATFNAPSSIYNGDHTDMYLTIDGCQFYGGGLQSIGGAVSRGGIAIEGGNHVTITDCDIYPAYTFTMSFIASRIVATTAIPHDNVIKGNRFHLDDYSKGGMTSRHPTEPPIILTGSGEFSGNTITDAGQTSTGYFFLSLGWYYETLYYPSAVHDTAIALANNFSITGNNYRDYDTHPNTNPGTIWIYNATNCTITGNTFQTAYTANPTFYYAGFNTGTTIVNGINNTLIHG